MHRGGVWVAYASALRPSAFGLSCTIQAPICRRSEWLLVVDYAQFAAWQRKSHHCRAHRLLLDIWST
jgi:hypothetical protein